LTFAEAAVLELAQAFSASKRQGRRGRIVIEMSPVKVSHSGVLGFLDIVAQSVGVIFMSLYVSGERILPI
jgi:hypothetical protein